MKPIKRKGDLLALGVFLSVLCFWYLGLYLAGLAEPPFGLPPRRAASSGRIRPASGDEWTAMSVASDSMRAAIAAVAAEAAARGEAIDSGTDPARTGLVGLEWSPLTTTLGSLPAKRTAAQPDAAALMVRLLARAGVKPGDLVAVESSGSFPGFAIASILAAESLGARTICLLSVGSSTWGANRPGFTLPDMVLALRARGFIHPDAIAVTPGGADDVGADLRKDEEGAAALAAALSRAAAAGAILLGTADLDRDVEECMAFLESRGRPSVLVSVGGNRSAAGLGETLLGRNGLIVASDFPGGAPRGQGLVQAFLRSGRPAIRILDVEDLAARTGLAFDPRPWPAPETASLWKRPRPPRLLAAAGPVLALALALLAKGMRGRISPTAKHREEKHADAR